MVYHELTTLRRVYFDFARAALALLIHDIPLRNIVEPLSNLPPNLGSSIQILRSQGGNMVLITIDDSIVISTEWN